MCVVVVVQIPALDRSGFRAGVHLFFTLSCAPQSSGSLPHLATVRKGVVTPIACCRPCGGPTDRRSAATSWRDAICGFFRSVFDMTLCVCARVRYVVLSYSVCVRLVIMSK